MVYISWKTDKGREKYKRLLQIFHKTLRWQKFDLVISRFESGMGYLSIDRGKSNLIGLQKCSQVKQSFVYKQTLLPARI